MKKITFIIFISILVSGCYEPEFLGNGLTKEAKKVTEIYLKTELDSLRNDFYDTISIKQTYYNDNNQISKTIEKLIFDDIVMDIDFIYDESKKLQKEIVKLPFDTSIVQYHYDNSQLIKTSTNKDQKDYRFSQITNHKYSQQNFLIEVLTSQIYIDKEFGDTMLNVLIVDGYNKKEQLLKSVNTDFINHENDKIIKYNYRRGILSKLIEYNKNDSLLLKRKFEYTFDDNKNWIVRKTKVENKINFIQMRDIEYD